MAGSSGAVALFIQDLQLGGAERVVVNLANGFVAAGLPVHVVVVRSGGALAASLDPRVPVSVLGNSRTMACLPPLVRWLEQHRPRLLVAHLENAAIAAIAARWLARSWWGRVAVVEHALPSRTWATAQGKDRWIARVAGWAYPWADVLITVSQRAADTWTTRLGNRCPPVVVIPNPIVDATFPARLASPPCPPLPAGTRPWIIGLGRLARVKEWPVLLQALAEPRLSGAALALLGDGPEAPALAQMAQQLGIADRVWMPGAVSDPLPYLAQARVLALPSPQEGFGNVVVEALAAGLPVVAIQGSGGPEEILDHGRYGRLVQPGDPVALANALADLLEDAPGADQRRARADDYRISRAVARYQALVAP